MRRPHTQPSPWEIFQSLYVNSRVCFFLDSGSFNPPNQRYSLIGANPFLEVELHRHQLHVRGEESGIFPPENLLPMLRRLFRKYKGREGRAVGFFGYELASLFEKKIRFRRKPNPGTPLLYLGFYRDVMVYDHREQKFRGNRGQVS